LYFNKLRNCRIPAGINPVRSGAAGVFAALCSWFPQIVTGMTSSECHADVPLTHGLMLLFRY